MVLGLIVSCFYLLTDFFYWAKFFASYFALKLWKATHYRRFDLYDFDDLDKPQKIGIIVPKEEEELESPFPDEHLEDAADEVFMYGVNTKSQCLLVRITRSCNNEAEAWIYLKVSNDRWYQLEEAMGYQRTYGEKCTSFSCGGLQMHYLIPMRRWRISYCGMLKEMRKDNPEEKKVFVKFAFLWSASSDVHDPGSDTPIKTTADAMAKAKWTSPFPPVERITGAVNYYSQSGVFAGTVSIQDENDSEMYLIGERIRHIGKGSGVAGSKFKHIMGSTPENGLMLHIARLSTQHVCHNLHYGFIVHPNGDIKIIEDGIIITRMSSREQVGKNLTVMFKAERNYELTGNFAETGLRFTSERGWNGHVELYEIEFEIDGCKGRGFMLSGNIADPPKIKIQRKNLAMPRAIPFVVSFTDEISHSTEVSGGKGSSLGQLTELSNNLKSFRVPKGIVVTTAAYSAFLTTEITEKIENLKNVVYGNTKGNMQETCKIVMTAVERAYLPDEITKEIEQKLGKIFDGKINHHKFAVRSSATGEDTDQMSAAGQMETFLGIQGLKEIFSAVKKCWASQFSRIAVEYKRQNGQILNSPMAVVIQEMAHCEAAGVLFTCDPVTNNPSVVVITGNYGLGETVVSGSEEPDTIVLQKVNGDIEIKSVMVGLKQHKLVLQDSETSEAVGTVTQDVPENERTECCISEEVIKTLGKLSLQVEKHFRSPRDIEWGVKNNIIYILQSRPITTVATVSDYEIKHEFDAPVRCDNEFFTICNVSEVMPGALSPLGLDVINKYFSSVFHRKELAVRQTNNFFQSKYFPNGLLPFYNHAMMSVVDVLTRMGDTESMMSKSIMIGIFGRMLDDPELKVLTKHKYVPHPKGISIMHNIEFAMNLFFSGSGIERVKKHVFNYNSPVEKCRTSKEAFDVLMKTFSCEGDAFLLHLTCTEMSSIWNMYVFTILVNAKGSIDNEVYSDFAKLLASSSNVESADVPSGLQNLAHWIAKDMKVEDFKSMPVEDAKEWLETSTTVSGYKFRKFMKRHGHRCLKEFDVHSIPWYEDPKSLVRLLQNMCGSCGSSKENKDEDFSKLVSGLNIRLDMKSRWLLRFVLPNCRRGVREREACKSNLVKAIDNIRKGFRHLSKRMVEEGFLPDTALMYFFTIDEINYLLQTRNPGLIARANHRRKLYPMLDGLIFPEISKGRPMPINESTDDTEEEYVSDLTMKGIPVSQGTVKGYVRVAISLEEAAHFKRGEILITYTTDIGWSPYFPLLAGVVTEIGGLISHGAVVSREYGLPCVVGLHGAVKKFTTGDYVLLDGNKGILKRLPPPEK